MKAIFRRSGTFWYVACDTIESVSVGEGEVANPEGCQKFRSQSSPGAYIRGTVGSLGMEMKALLRNFFLPT